MKKLKLIIDALLSKKIGETIEIDTEQFLSDLQQKIADKLLNALALNESFKEDDAFTPIVHLVDDLVAKLFTPENIKKGQATITLSFEKDKSYEEQTRENSALFKKINTIWKKEGLAYIGYNPRHQKITITLQ